MKTRMLSKGLVITVIILFLGVGVQPAFAEIINEDNISEFSEITRKINSYNSSNYADDIDDIKCFTENTELFGAGYLLGVLLLFEFDFLRVQYRNDNDVSLSVIERYEVTTFTGRVIYNFSRNRNVKADSSNSHTFMTRMRNFKSLYTFGPFKFTFEVFVKNDNSSRKVLFRGFILFVTAIIFNERGEIIK
jgi:hypothetical protein